MNVVVFSERPAPASSKCSRFFILFNKINISMTESREQGYHFSPGCDLQRSPVQSSGYQTISKYSAIYLLGWRETCYTRRGQLLFRGGQQLYCLIFFTKVNKFSVTLEVSDGRDNLSFQIVLLNLLLLIFNQFRLNIGNLIFLKIAILK